VPAQVCESKSVEQAGTAISDENALVVDSKFMNRLTASISILLCVFGLLALKRRLLSASDMATIFSVRASAQSAITADPDSSFWKQV
jgi:hypothetical protein